MTAASRTTMIRLAVVAALSATALAVLPAPADATSAFQFTGRGWGHGVGMSQYGALEQARDGIPAGRIIAHYYSGAQATQRNLGVLSDPINIGLSQNQGSVTIRSNGTASRIRFGGPNEAVRELPANGTARFDELDDGRCRLQINGTTAAHASACWANVARTDSGYFTISNEAVRYGRGHLELRPNGGKTFHVAATLPNIDSYLLGLREVPADWPTEALRAQAIAARSYAAYDLLGGDLDAAACHCHLYDSVKSQVYGGTTGETDAWRRAVTDTAAQVVWAEGATGTRGGGVVQAFYSSSSGGRTEAVEDSSAFGIGPRPYFSSVDDPWSLRASNPYASWVIDVPEAAIRSKLQFDDVTSIRVTARNTSGSARQVTFTGRRGDSTVTTTTAGDELRGLFGLRSGYIASIFLPPFTDDDGNIHESAIAWLSAEGITAGCNPPANDRFCPDGTVTRGQMAAFLTRALNLPPGEEQFRDTGSSIFAEDIAAIAKADITRGCNPPANDRYCPDAPVTRAQMASFLTRALELTRQNEPFTDVDSSDVHARDIGALAARGITRGCNPPDNTRYCPDAPITRAQMATFLNRGMTK